jgi:hypothetical protein
MHYIGIVLLSLAFLGREHEDAKGGSSVRVSPGWQVVESEVMYDAYTFKPKDGRLRNILIADEPIGPELEAVKARYEKSFAETLRGFKLISSGMTRTAKGVPAVEIIHENHHSGVKIRQYNYVLDYQNKKRFLIVLTVLKSDRDRFRPVIKGFVDSFDYRLPADTERQ